MSKIPCAFVLDEPQVATLRELATRKNWRKFWSTLKQTGPDHFESFEFSGNVVEAMATFMEEQRGIEWQQRSRAELPMGVGEFELLLTADECRKLEGEIATVEITDAEFVAYWLELTGEAWEGAGIALRRARCLLADALGACRRSGDRLFLDVG